MAEKSLFSDKEYRAWIKDIKDRIRRSQVKASVKINASMLELYWSIGADIVNKQTESKWGSGVIEQLSKDLRGEFPEAQGYSMTNLRLMKRFFLFYAENGTGLVPKPESPIRYQLGTELQEGDTAVGAISAMSSLPAGLLAMVPWRHHVEIIRHCDTVEKALFFVSQTVEHGWSRGVLLNFLDTDLYERQGKAITNFNRALPNPQSDLANEALKDPYNFDFLTLTSDYRERELEDALAENITKFLLELGQGFAFIGRQVPLEIGETEVFLDLLFYHLELQCYVAVELKATDFKAADTGQLGLYVSAINHIKKKDTDNPTIGLLICKTKDNVMAQWSLESSSQPIGISEYKISEVLREEYGSSLPSIDEIEAQLKGE